MIVSTLLLLLLLLLSGETSGPQDLKTTAQGHSELDQAPVAFSLCPKSLFELIELDLVPC